MLLAIGLILLNYPALATLQGNYLAQKTSKSIIADYSVSSEMLDMAREYNRELVSHPIFDPWLTKMRHQKTQEYSKYLLTLNVDGKGAMGRVVIPSINSSLPVYHDSTDTILSKGAGHFFGSHLPIGAENPGDTRMAIITAHSGLPNNTMFDRLPDLKIGEQVFFQTGSLNRAWRVTKKTVIKPEDMSQFKMQEGKDRLLLITCTPYGINTHRLVVEAERDWSAEKSLTSEKIDKQIGPNVPLWVKAIFTTDSLILGIIIFRFIKKKKMRVAKR